jgi:hypothetical protein
MKTIKIFKDLHSKVRELPENFRDFVCSECNWDEPYYFSMLKHPEDCSPEDCSPEALKTIIKVAEDLNHDLTVLVNRCKKSIN